MILITAALTVIFALQGQRESRQEANTVVRPGFGEGARTESRRVEGLEEEAVEVELKVPALHYGEAEMERVFEDCYQWLLEEIKGENESLDHVEGPLTLPLEYKNMIRLSWESDDPSCLTSQGEPVLEQEGQSQDVGLWVTMYCGESRGEYLIPIRVVSEIRSQAERLTDFLNEYLKENPQKDTLVLPQDFQGKKLSYYQGEENVIWMLFPILGGAVLVFLPARQKQKEREKKEERKRSLLMDYHEMVAEFSVLIQAGLTVRSAWERMCGLNSRRNQRLRPYQEEMETSLVQLKNGRYEAGVYQEFGQRCGLMPYIKFGGLLAQNVTKGGRELVILLEQEAAAAFEDRKNLARRQGQEAGTKLMGPMFLMFGLVLAIIMIPAFMSF